MCHTTTLLFITQDNSVIFADARNHDYWALPVEISGEKISNTTTYSSLIIIWCCEDECAFVSTRSSGEFTTHKKYKLDTSSHFTHINADGSNIKLLPGWKNASGEYDPFLFMPV